MTDPTQSDVQAVEPVAWLCRDLIMEQNSVTLDRDFAMYRAKHGEAWEVSPLYADRADALATANAENARLKAENDALRLDHGRLQTKAMAAVDHARDASAERNRAGAEIARLMDAYIDEQVKVGELLIELEAVKAERDSALGDATSALNELGCALDYIKRLENDRNKAVAQAGALELDMCERAAAVADDAEKHNKEQCETRAYPSLISAEIVAERIRDLETNPDAAAALQRVREASIREALIWVYTSVGHEADNPAILKMVEDNYAALIRARGDKGDK